MAICVPWKCASQYVKHTMKTFKENKGLNSTKSTCGLTFDQNIQKETKICKEISKDFDYPEEWAATDIALSQTTSRFDTIKIRGAFPNFQISRPKIYIL